ncbi:MAG: hypothetical protein AAF556_01090, partial [Pseudomonadota bacterium]
LDAILVGLILVPCVIGTMVWASAGLTADGAFGLLFLMLACAAAFGLYRYHRVKARVMDALYRPLVVAFDLTHGRRVPGRALLYPQYRALGLLPGGTFRRFRHWANGRIGGAMGQIFEAEIWALNDDTYLPERKFHGICARFDLARPFEGSVILDGQGRVQEGSNLKLAGELLTAELRDAIALFPYDQARIVLRDGLLFISVNLNGPWYQWPGPFVPQDGAAHVKRICRDIEAAWRLAASTDGLPLVTVRPTDQTEVFTL